MPGRNFFAEKLGRSFVLDASTEAGVNIGRATRRLLRSQSQHSGFFRPFFLSQFTLIRENCFRGVLRRVSRRSRSRVGQRSSYTLLWGFTFSANRKAANLA